MIQQKTGLKGKIRLEHYNAQGELLQVREQDNLVVNGGKTLAVQRLAGITATAVSHIAVGTDNTAAAAAQTALIAETHRESCSAALATVTTANDSVILESTFNFAGSFAIVESGLFNDATTGTMFNRAVFSVVNVNNGDSIVFKWTITATSA